MQQCEYYWYPCHFRSGKRIVLGITEREAKKVNRSPLTPYAVISFWQNVRLLLMTKKEKGEGGYDMHWLVCLAINVCINEHGITSKIKCV